MSYISPYDMVSLECLIEQYNLTIPNRQRDNWRWTFPNVGYIRGFEHFGNVFIHATNGILAYYRIDESGSLWLGHVSSFVGPIAKEYVYEEDWDWIRNTRKVNVFKRADGSIVVIPKDVFWDHYWNKHQRMSKEEHAIYCEVGHSITIADVDGNIAKLQVKTFSGDKRVGYKEKSKRQKLLDTL
jgi:hypothetical protein